MTYALEKAGLLAQVRDARAVVMREHLVAKNSVRNLRRVQQVHLEQPRLQVTLLRLVLLQSVEEE